MVQKEVDNKKKILLPLDLILVQHQYRLAPIMIHNIVHAFLYKLYKIHRYYNIIVISLSAKRSKIILGRYELNLKYN